MIERIPPQVRSLEERISQAIEVAKANDGTLVRYPGSFWSRSGLRKFERPWFGPLTIQELVDRGLFVYSEKDDHGGWIEVTLIAE